MVLRRPVEPGLPVTKTRSFSFAPVLAHLKYSVWAGWPST